MSQPTYDGHYPIESRTGEIERLLAQSVAMAPGAEAMLDLIGVGEGWRALDIGCGPGGITDLLSRRVGASGRVVGLDMNAGFLDVERKSAPANVTFVEGDAYSPELTQHSFDLVHMRFVASTAGEPERLIAAARHLARAGGTVALEEPDASSLHCYPPSPAWDALKRALIGAFEGVGADLLLARRLYWVARHAGLENVQLRTFIVAVRSGDPMTDYLPSTVESLRSTVLELGLMSEAELGEALAECRRHLADPETSFTMYTVAQVWGRTPA